MKKRKKKKGGDSPLKPRQLVALATRVEKWAEVEQGKNTRTGRTERTQRCKGVEIEIWWTGSREKAEGKGQGGERLRGNTERETRGNYCSVNGTQSNFLLLKKSFIYVDSLLVMYSSVNPPPTHTHSASMRKYNCVFRLHCGCKLEGREAVLNCTDRINMQLRGGTEHCVILH